MKEHSLKKRYIFKLLSNIVNSLIGVVLVSIVPKALGPISYGYFTYLQQFFSKLIAFFDMGSSIAFFTKLSARNNRKELIVFYFLYSFFIFLGTFIFIYLCNKFDYTDNFLPNIPNEYIYWGFYFSFLYWFSEILFKIADAYALTVSVEIIKIIYRILSLLILLFLIYKMNLDLFNYFYFQIFSISIFISGILFLFINKEIFKFVNIQFKFLLLIKEFFEYIHPLFVYSIFGLIVGFFDIWLLQKYGGSTQMGFYGLSYSIAAMCFLFTSAMTPIIMREFAKSFENKDLKEMRRLFYRYIPMLYAIAAYFGVFISVQSENVLNIFTDSRFMDAKNVLMLMALYPIHQTYGQLSSSVFYATSQTKLYRNIGIFSMSLGVVVSFVLIYLLDLRAIGLVEKMLLTQVISVNISLYFNSKFLKLDFKYFIFHQFYTILILYSLAFISSVFINFNSSLFNFLISGIIYTIFVIIIICIFPQIFSLNRNEIKDILKYVKTKIKK